MGHGGLTRTRSRGPMQAERKRKRSLSVVEEEDVGQPQEDFSEPWEESIDEPGTLNKYKISGNIATHALSEALKKCVPGASCAEICKDIDELISKLTAEHFAKTSDEEGQHIRRGLAFPTTVSPNVVAANFTPVDPKQDIKLEVGDVVRVELGAHIDGYIATAAHTKLVAEDQMSDEATKTFKDVAASTWLAAQTVLHSLKPGVTNHEITDLIKQVSFATKFEPVQGCLSHRMARYEEMGDQVIMNVKVQSAADTQNQEDVTIRENTVWNVDVAFITVGSGQDNKLRVNSNYEPTIFRRSDVLQPVKMKSSHYVFNTLKQKGKQGYLPFSLRVFEKLGSARLGILEMKTNGLIDPFPVLCCKPGQVMARYKWTVLVTSTAVERIASGPFDIATDAQMKLLPEKIQALLRQPLRIIPKAKRMQKKKIRRTGGDNEQMEQ